MTIAWKTASDLRIFAPAKVNLALHILGKRQDGYHDLSSLVGFTRFGDVIDYEEADALGVVFSGQFSDGLDVSDNSVVDAVRWFENVHDVAVNWQINVTKNIPPQGGLGGGTADCAAILHALYDHYKIEKPEPQELVRFGADVPVSFYGKTAIMTGVGETIFPCLLDQDFGIVLVNPNVAVSTRAVFKMMDQYAAPIPMQSHFGIKDLAVLENTMTAPATELCPEIGELISSIEGLGAPVVRMSGSGSTVFALTKLGEEKSLNHRIKTIYPTYTVIETQMMRSTT